MSETTEGQVPDGNTLTGQVLDPVATPKVYDEAHVTALRAENAKHRTENNQLAARLAELEAKDKAAKEAELSELERYKLQAQEAKDKAEKAERELKTVALQNRFAGAAQKAGLTDIDAAYKLAVADNLIEPGAELDDTQLAAKIKELTTKRSFLLVSTAQSAVNPTKTTSGTEPTRTTLATGHDALYGRR